jgi:hypothetical protein
LKLDRAGARLPRRHTHAAFAEMLGTLTVDQPSVGAGQRPARPLGETAGGGRRLDGSLLLRRKAGNSEPQDGDFDRAQRYVRELIHDSLRMGIFCVT